MVATARAFSRLILRAIVVGPALTCALSVSPDCNERRRSPEYKWVRKSRYTMAKGNSDERRRTRAHSTMADSLSAIAHGTALAFPARVPVASSRLAGSFRDRRGFARIRHLDHEIFEPLRRARIARHRVQRVRGLVEHLARLQRANGPVVDLHLVGAFEDVADGVAAGMAVRGTAVAGIAL